MKPFFTVVIPLFNKEKFVKETIKSVLNQTFKSFELIIVNDGSTDKSLAIVSEFNDNRITILNQNNKGVSSARNWGIESSNTNFICFLDADDIWKPNHLEVLHNIILKFPDAKLYCSRYITQISKNKFTKNIFENINDNYEGYVDDFFKSSLINRIALTSAVCIKKQVYNELGGFDTNISSGQDLDYWIKIALNNKVAISNKITLVYNYIGSNKSLSKTQIDKKQLPNFNQYLTLEKTNNSLKKFLDVYRIEYALHYHIIGLENKCYDLLKNVDQKNIHFKTKLLLKTPSIILSGLLKMKHFLKKYGIDFTVYH